MEERKKDYHCEICKRWIQTQQALVNYREKYHSSAVPKHQCHVCGKILSSDSLKSHLDLHVKKHAKVLSVAKGSTPCHTEGNGQTH